VQNVFQQNQQMGFLSAFVQQGVKRLSPQPQPETVG
jgi:uncharacterized protein